MTKVVLIALVIILPSYSNTVSIANLVANNVEEDVTKIYDLLLQATGLNDKTEPKLVIRNKLEYGKAYASYNHRDNKITLYTEVLECLHPNIQKKAIAFTLAHELRHYFDCKRSPEKCKKTFDERDAQVERNADEFGAVLAEMAGFKIRNFIDEIYDPIYEVFCPNGKASFDSCFGSNYPPLSERKRVAIKAQKNIDKYGNALEMANCFIAIGMYDAAFHLYEFIDDKFYYLPSIKNNRSVLLTQRARLALRNNKRTFSYPLSLSSNNYFLDKIPQGTSSPSDLLKEAEKGFQSILKENPNWHEVHTNLACVYVLQDNLPYASRYADSALIHGYKSQIGTINAKIIKGITYHYKGDSTERDKCFREAKNKSLKSTINVPTFDTYQVISTNSFKRYDEAEQFLKAPDENDWIPILGLGDQPDISYQKKSVTSHYRYDDIGLNIQMTTNHMDFAQEFLKNHQPEISMYAGIGSNEANKFFISVFPKYSLLIYWDKNKHVKKWGYIYFD